MKQQLSIVENGVHYSARRYNDLKINNEKLTKDLKRLLDELDGEKKNYETLDAMKKVRGESSLKIFKKTKIFPSFLCLAPTSHLTFT